MDEFRQIKSENIPEGGYIVCIHGHITVLILRTGEFKIKDSLNNSEIIIPGQDLHDLMISIDESDAWSLAHHLTSK